ncbi:GGDEF domain-containing protein [Vibrio agarivorans]|uniref:GGDEF domain-containing protein n=1 Tax=Vibrio agarivorans TaxID=153622 RepID=UPI00223011C8|nr:GGDEF domain-containing protein [Vibrio agarivorans]MDN3660026.1 GGDEF domain-containing protein [Vibrio agarivorans]
MSSSFISSSWFKIGLPIFFLTLVSFSMSSIIQATSANLDVAINLPYVLFISAIAIAHAFKQSRSAMIATAMLVAYYVIQVRLQSPLTSGTTLLELSLLSFLLPVACLMIYVFSDSRVTSVSFMVYAGLVSMFVFWCYLILTHFYEGGFEDISEEFLFSVDQLSRLPFLLLMYQLALIGSTAMLVIHNNRNVDAIVYSSILMTSAAFIFFHVPYISSTLFSIAGIFLLFYIASSSYQLAFNDGLTGIPGRHALEMDMKQLGRRYSIAMLDIDHFKSFNDTYGHDTGDDVLKLVASRMTRVKGNAKVYRYGGEEFTVLYNRKYANQTYEYLDDLREDIANYEMKLRDADSRPTDDKVGSKQRKSKKAKSDMVKVTISIGVADSTCARKPVDVIKAADEALYKAKKKGRNRVEIAKPPVS